MDEAALEMQLSRDGIIQFIVLISFRKDVANPSANVTDNSLLPPTEPKFQLILTVIIRSRLKGLLPLR